MLPLATASTSASPLPSTLPPLIGHTLPQLEALVAEMGHPAFRAKQLYHWLYVRCARDWDTMTDLSKAFRAQLAERFSVGTLALHTQQHSEDGTRKYLFTLQDGQVVESVLMHFQERNCYAICLSTQVGCAMNCSFCATGKLGLKRHLTTAEIVEQYLFVQHHSGCEIRNVVFMGQGEPLHNYDNTLAAIQLLNEGAEVGMRRITVSTSGMVDAITRLAGEHLPLTLAVSLHAPTNALREHIMPINKRWPLEVLMPALHAYVATTHRRLTIEYILIDGINDTAENAHQLGALLQGLRANVNLIPYNPIAPSLLPAGGAHFKRSPRSAVERFGRIVAEQYGKKVTVRLERGADIDAACGQLANQVAS
jgi:23S rRNA (adenine2503-C2)-methyltransferase